MLPSSLARAVLLVVLAPGPACSSDPLPAATPPSADAAAVDDAKIADARADAKAALADAGADAALADAALPADAAVDAPPLPDAPVTPDARGVDAGSDGAPDDGPPPFACLPDGSGRITLKATGGLTI